MKTIIQFEDSEPDTPMKTIIQFEDSEPDTPMFTEVVQLECVRSWVLEYIIKSNTKPRIVLRELTAGMIEALLPVHVRAFVEMALEKPAHRALVSVRLHGGVCAFLLLYRSDGGQLAGINAGPLDAALSDQKTFVGTEGQLLLQKAYSDLLRDTSEEITISA